MSDTHSAESESVDAVSKATVEQLQKEIETWREVHAIDNRRANEAVTENIRLRVALERIASAPTDGQWCAVVARNALKTGDTHA